MRPYLLWFLTLAALGAWVPAFGPYLLRVPVRGGLGFGTWQAGGVYALAAVLLLGASLLARCPWTRRLDRRWAVPPALLGSGVALLAATRQTQFVPVLVLLGAHGVLTGLALSLTVSPVLGAQGRRRARALWLAGVGVVGLVAGQAGLVAWRELAAGRERAVPGDLLYLAGWLCLAAAVLGALFPLSGTGRGLDSQAGPR